MTTTVGHMKRDQCDIFIGRPSILGNPFKIGNNGTRKEVIDKYKDYFYKSKELKQYAEVNCKDKILGCYCNPLACHGDIIAEYLNGLEKDEKRTASS